MLYHIDDFNRDVMDFLYLQILEDTDPAILFEINGKGGDVMAFQALLSALEVARMRGQKIITYNIGSAYSCCFGLFCEGDEGSRYALPHSMFMAHKTSMSYNTLSQNIIGIYNIKNECNLSDKVVFKNKIEQMSKIFHQENITKKVLDKILHRFYGITPTIAMDVYDVQKIISLQIGIPDEFWILERAPTLAQYLNNPTCFHTTPQFLKQEEEEREPLALAS